MSDFKYLKTRETDEGEIIAKNTDLEIAYQLKRLNDFLEKIEK